MSTRTEVVRRLLDADSPTAVYRALVVGVERTLDHRAVAFAFDPDRDSLVPVAAAAGGGEEDADEHRADSLVRTAYATGEMQSADRVDADPPLVAHAETALAVPLGEHGVLAVMGLESQEAEADIGAFETAVGLFATVATDRLDRLEQPTDCSGAQDLERSLETALDVSEAIRQASTRDSLERAVCDAIVSRDGVAFAWIGDLEDGRVVPRTVAGSGQSYLDTVDFSLDDSLDEPAVTTASHRRPSVVEHIGDDRAAGEWRDVALATGLRTVVSVPIGFGDRFFGVLSVFGDLREGFTEPFRRVIVETGASVGAGIAYLQLRRALASDAVEELGLAIDDGDGFVGGLVDRGVEYLTFERIIPEDDELSVFFTVPDVDDQLHEALASAPFFEAVTDLPVEGARLYHARVARTDAPLLATLHTIGGDARSLSVDDDATTLELDVPMGTDVSDFIDTLAVEGVGVRLASRTTRTREATTAGTFLAEASTALTERQLAAVRTGFNVGYFEWPRQHTGEEVAALLGISQPTFARHLRKAQQKLFSLLFHGD